MPIRSDHVVHGIACFLHGTDGDGFNKVLLFLSLNIIQQVVDGLGMSVFGSAGAQFVAEAGNELCQVIQLFRVREVVNTIGEYFRLSCFWVHVLSFPLQCGWRVA